MSKMLKMEVLGTQVHSDHLQEHPETTREPEEEPSRMGPVSYLLLIAVALGLGAVTWRAWGPVEKLKGTESSGTGSSWALPAPEEEAHTPPAVVAEKPEPLPEDLALTAPEPPVLPPVQPESEAPSTGSPPSPAPLQEMAAAEPPIVADQPPAESPPASTSPDTEPAKPRGGGGSTLVEPINGHFHL